jgi:hypothetical protein
MLGDQRRIIRECKLTSGWPTIRSEVGAVTSAGSAFIVKLVPNTQLPSSFIQPKMPTEASSTVNSDLSGTDQLVRHAAVLAVVRDAGDFSYGGGERHISLWPHLLFSVDEGHVRETNKT